MANLSEVYFYHVTKQTVASALPQLLSKAKDVGWTVFIRCKDEASLKFIDDAIWTVQPESLSLNGALISTEEVSKYRRCALLFDDKNSDEVNIAREQWMKFTKAYIRAKYWSQETGTWSLKQEN